MAASPFCGYHPHLQPMHLNHDAVTMVVVVVVTSLQLIYTMILLLLLLCSYCSSGSRCVAVGGGTPERSGATGLLLTQQGPQQRTLSVVSIRFQFHLYRLDMIINIDTILVLLSIKWVDAVIVDGLSFLAVLVTLLPRDK
jgi:hypothetical protein